MNVQREDIRGKEIVLSCDVCGHRDTYPMTESLAPAQTFTCESDECDYKWVIARRRLQEIYRRQRRLQKGPS